MYSHSKVDALRPDRPRRVGLGSAAHRAELEPREMRKRKPPISKEPHTVASAAEGRSRDIDRSAEIVDFVHRWYAYGGGSDFDIFVQFGLPARVFYTRAARLLRDRKRHPYPAATIAAMQQVCRVRLGVDRQTPA